MASKQVIYVCNSDYSRILYASDGFCHKFNVERNNPYNVSIARGISFYIDAVSYTHLDVYKRQTEHITIIW